MRVPKDLVPDTVLLVDDDADAVFLFERAYQRAGITYPFAVAQSADEAIAYLTGEGRYADRATYPMPALILLDIKMPGRTGFEVLQWIRNNSAVSPLRVVMLTGSPYGADVNQAYRLGANSYLTKPTDLDEFRDILGTLCAHWLRHSKPPELTEAASVELGESASTRPVNRPAV
jgi:CheY-like chemotaxis protein